MVSVVRNLSEGPRPGHISRASGPGDASFATAFPARSPAIGTRPRARTVVSPQRPASSGTNDEPEAYISPSPADTQGEGEIQDHAEDGELSNKEHVARLVEQAKCGRPDAFGEIYRLHHDALFRYARYRLGKQAAEDAVAETFARAWQGLPRYRATGAPFVSWLYGIARHVVVDTGNSERKAEPRAEFPDYAIESALGTVDHIALRDAISSLPQKQRQVIELKFIIGLTNEEVGAHLNKSPGAVNAQQWRALDNLKKLLEKR